MRVSWETAKSGSELRGNKADADWPFPLQSSSIFYAGLKAEVHYLDGWEKEVLVSRGGREK